MVNNELQHYGVKGMKWGVIRIKPTNRTNNSRSRKTESNGKKTVKSSVKKSPSASVLKKHVKAGKDYLDNISKEDVQKVLTNTASVAAGALWIASAFIPGNVSGTLNAVAAVSNMVAVASGGPGTEVVD